MDGTEDARASSVLPSVIHTCTFFPDGTRTVLRCIAKAALLSLFRSQCFNACSPFFLSECTAWLVGDQAVVVVWCVVGSSVHGDVDIDVRGGADVGR